MLFMHKILHQLGWPKLCKWKIHLIWTGAGICPTTAWCDMYWRLTSRAGPSGRFHGTFQVSICPHVCGSLCWGVPWSVPRRWLWWKERSKSLRTCSQQRHRQFWMVWIDFDDVYQSFDSSWVLVALFFSRKLWGCARLVLLLNTSCITCSRVWFVLWKGTL